MSLLSEGNQRRLLASSSSPLQGERVGEQSVSAILIAALRAGRRKNVL
jgi:hypothetical protein